MSNQVNTQFTTHTNAGKGSANTRSPDYEKRRASPFYQRSACCNSHFKMINGNRICVYCGEICEIKEP